MLLTDPTTGDTKLWNLILNNSTVDIVVRVFAKLVLLTKSCRTLLY